MKILVTGAKGFVGRNLVAQLKNIMDGKARCYGDLAVSGIYEYDVDSTQEQLDGWCSDCDFVFNLAGVNRPQNQEEFMQGNCGFAGMLLDMLKKHGNKCPVMISSSIQATLAGRFGTSEYGRSKKAGEELVFEYGRQTGVKVLVYRFPNLFGKWCRPNYNSAIATFCNNIANDLPIQVNDRNVEMELLYIDDLVDEMINALKGNEHRCEFEGVETMPVEDGRYCYCPVTHKAMLGEIVDMLYSFAAQPKTLEMPEIPSGSLAKKLYSTYLSYLPKEKVAVCRLETGEVLNRRIDSDEVVEFEVSGERIEAVHMLPGYTHNIINLSKTENLVTVMWANETFDPDRPDTYFEPVE